MSQPIQGRIAQILSENMIIINVGAQAGVRRGMQFAVLMQGEEVTDPETGEVLGRWEVPKGYVVATHVQDRLATCEGCTPGRHAQQEDPSTNVLSAALIAHSMRPETWRAATSTKLKVNRSEVAGMPAVGPISVGDVVRQIESVPPEPSAAPEPTTKPPAAEKTDDEAQS